MPRLVLNMEQLRVCWISAGVSSFISGYLANKEKPVDKFIYIHIEDQHPDSLRFIKDCEKVLNCEIEILQSEYQNKANVIKTFRFINSPYGAKCTEILKKRVRKEWEYHYKNYDIIYIWGFDNTEKDRALRLEASMPNFTHEFPLIKHNLSKAQAHGILQNLNIRRPIMYDMGYSNNNCIGCVKGGMGYWNKIRNDFPEVFSEMAQLEREVGHSCIKNCFLDELAPNRGRLENTILPDCGIACELLL